MQAASASPQTAPSLLAASLGFLSTTALLTGLLVLLGGA